MASFFEKLKRGMGVDVPPVEVEKTKESEEKKEKKQASQKRQKSKKEPGARLNAERRSAETNEDNPRYSMEVKKITIKDMPAEEETEEPLEETKEKTAVPNKEKTEKTKWFEQDGQLAIDVYQTENDLVVQSAIAGVKYNELEVTIEKDMMSIKGTRKKIIEEEGDYFTQECYWGSFSREIILPAEIDPGRATAEMKEGVLTIRLPKILREKKRRVAVKG